MSETEQCRSIVYIYIYILSIPRAFSKVKCFQLSKVMQLLFMKYAITFDFKPVPKVRKDSRLSNQDSNHRAG